MLSLFASQPPHHPESREDLVVIDRTRSPIACLRAGLPRSRTVSRQAFTAQGRCKAIILASALAMLCLSWPAESQQTLTSRTNAARNRALASEAEQVRQLIRGVVESVDARRWESLTDDFAESVYVDYTSLFGGFPRNYTAGDLVDNWRQLLEPFSMTEHVLGPIVVHGDTSKAQAKCPVRINHFLRGAPGGEEWVVIGQFVFTLEKRDGTWRIEGLVLDVRSQEGNRNLLVEAFAPANRRLPCEGCVVGNRAQQGQPASTVRPSSSRGPGAVNQDF